MEEDSLDKDVTNITYNGEFNFNKVPAAGTSPNTTDDNVFHRESLGILPTNALLGDSLTEIFGTPRESLGILNLSSLDLGRDSVAIFSVKKSLSGYNKSSEFQLGGFTNRNFTTSIENGNPQILVSTTEDKISKTSLELNKAFLFSSNRISCASSGSSEPSFHLRSLEEPSRISPNQYSEKDESLQFAFAAASDPFNDAFHISLKENLHSITSKSGQIFNSLSQEIKSVRKRIQSLPFTFESDLLCEAGICKKTDKLNASGDRLRRRGLEYEPELENFVFLETQNQQDYNVSSQSDPDKSFDKGRYLLDSTPQPDWAEWDSSKSNAENSPMFNHEKVSKAIDKMLGMQPLKLEQEIKAANVSKCSGTSSVNQSANISKISKASQCNILEQSSINSNNLSKASRCSDENVNRAIKNLSDILSEKESLSKSQKNEGRNILNRLASLLSDNSDVAPNSEDSGHSSVTDDPFEAKVQPENKTDSNEKLAQPLDLSVKSKSVNNSQERSESDPKMSFTGNLPLNTLSAANQTKPVGINCNPLKKIQENATSDRRPSIIAPQRQSKVSFGSDQLKRPKTSLARKEPLRATLPVEKMSKVSRVSKQQSGTHVTPERQADSSKFALKSNRTSTPLQEPKLKPMAASTPTNNHSKTPSPFIYPSPSNQPLKHGRGNATNTMKASSKTECASLRPRSNSFRDRAASCEKEKTVSAVPKLQRSLSTGKEPRIYSVLAKVRQNLINSPYYKAKSEELGSNAPKSNNLGYLSTRAPQSMDLGKENLKPSR